MYILLLIYVYFIIDIDFFYSLMVDLFILYVFVGYFFLKLFMKICLNVKNE